ncbi:MAG: ATP-binding protein [Deltaproteobacteria bacterium]|nr:ATP-binding protein [Deltaproteobacteria bacterium]
MTCPIPFHLHFETQSDFAYLPFLTRLFKALGIASPNALTQILVEAYNNAVIHAHHRNKKEWIGIEIDVETKKISIRVLDHGFGMKKNPAKKKVKGQWETSGRGMDLIRALSDKMSYTKKGNVHIFEATKFLKL